MKTCFRQRLTGALGYPIDENPSPEMYEAGYKALGIPWRYQLMEVKPENLKAALEGIRALGFEGVNLTIPHKIAAVAYMDRLSESARLIGDINTVINRDGELIGDNTDGKGFVIGMEKRGVSLEGKRIVLLGAGGAARAIAVECALAGAKELTVAARREEPGKELCIVIQNMDCCKSSFIKWVPGLQIPDCDILINATNSGLYPDSGCPDICYENIKEGMIVQDIITNPAETLFLKKAKEKGALTFDGLSMLVYQGALAAQMWSGELPPAEAMYKALEQIFKS